MKHHIAIDNVCAWPNLTRLPDGTIIVTAWYSSAVPGVHERDHMGAAVWTIEEMDATVGGN